MRRWAVLLLLAMLIVAVFPVAPGGASPDGISGTVTDDTGTALDGICVDLIEAGAIVDSAVTGPDGTYSLPFPDPEKSYFVYFSDCSFGDYLPQMYPDQEMYAPDEPTHPGAQAVTSGTTGVDASMSPAAHITGQVSPVHSGVCAFATSDADAVVGFGLSDLSGAFEIPTLPTGMPLRVHFTDCTRLPGQTAFALHDDQVTLADFEVRTITTQSLSPALESIGWAHGEEPTTDWEGDGLTASDPLEVWLSPVGSWWHVEELPKGSAIVKARAYDASDSPMSELHIEFLANHSFFSVRSNGVSLPSCSGPGDPLCVISIESQGDKRTVRVRFARDSGVVEIVDGRPETLHGVGVVNMTSGEWKLRVSTTTRQFYFGNPGDFPFLGDWDCDGEETPGLYRRSDGYVYLRNSNTQGVADTRFFFGDPGDVPIAGDFDGDGCDTVSIYRPSEARFYVINRLGSDDKGLGWADLSFEFGNPGDKPFVGDFDGDGVDEVGLHRESTGRVYYRNTLTSGFADNDFIFGDPGDQLVAGDWIRRGFDTPGAYRWSTRRMYLRFSNSQGVADQSFILYFESVNPALQNLVPVAGRIAP